MAPDTDTFERALRQRVRRSIKNGEEVTINSARAAVEAELRLESGFFKNDPEWKARSKDVISAAVHEESDASDADNDSRTKRPKQEQGGRATKRARGIESEDSADLGRNGTDPQDRKSTKPSESTISKQRRSPVTKSADSRNKNAGKASNGKAARSSPANDNDDDDDDDLDSGSETMKAISAASDVEASLDDGESDSDMSVVLDEPPKKQRRGKGKGEASDKKAAGIKSSSTAKVISPDEEHIKTLQSQLRQCGINKLWHRELAPYDAPKDKVRHLKSMLHDAGITGRFSADKARQIKEARELKDELESAKQFEKSFGAESTSGRARRSRATNKVTIVDNGDSDDDEDNSAASTRLATGLVDFGDSGDDGSD